MPIYEFSCKKCGHGFEALRLSSAGFKDVECPKCHGKNVQKKMSTFAAAVSTGHSHGSCEGGSCPAPSFGGGCPSGMCGLN